MLGEKRVQKYRLAESTGLAEALAGEKRAKARKETRDESL